MSRLGLGRHQSGAVCAGRCADPLARAQVERDKDPDRWAFEEDLDRCYFCKREVPARRGYKTRMGFICADCAAEYE